MQIQAITAATVIDWRTWIRGILGAGISAAAGATGTLTGVDVAIDGATFKQKMLAMGIAAAVSAIVSIGKFLQTHPLPDDAGSQDA